ncbi:MAG: ribulose-phosphate 3-epimerase [Sphaerochaetaceae bacterium]
MNTVFNAMDRSRLLLDVSLWSAPLTDIDSGIRFSASSADLYHLDVADAHFVPVLLLFPDLIAAINTKTDKVLHVHLMMDEPLGHLDSFIEAGADIITIHAELGNKAVEENISYLRQKGIAVGLALCVESDVSVLDGYLDRIDLVLLMGTPIGVKGVGMDSRTPDRVRAIKAKLRERGLLDQVVVSVDGGIRTETVPAVRQAGADMITPGSLVFKSKDLKATAAWLHGLQADHQGKVGI